MNLNKRWLWLLIGVPLAFMLLFFVMPQAVLLVESFRNAQGQVTLQNYWQFFSDGYYWSVLFFTFKIALWVTAVSLLIGYPMAYYITQVVRHPFLKRLLYIVVVTPLFTSNIVRSFGWLVLLGRTGLVNGVLMGLGLSDHPVKLLYTEFSIVIAMVYIMVPFVVLSVAGVLQNINPFLSEAALDLGARAEVAFARVTFPLSFAGVTSAFLIVFTLSGTAFVTPEMMSGGRYKVMSMLIYEQYAAVFNPNFGAALAVVLLATSMVLIAGYLRVIDRQYSQAT